MFSQAVTEMLIRGFFETLYMTLVSTFFGYLLGLPMGITLAVTNKDGIRPNRAVYKVLDFIANIIRSIPFLILLILIIPLTRAIVGKSYGPTAGHRAADHCGSALYRPAWWNPRCRNWTRGSSRQPRAWAPPP